MSKYKGWTIVRPGVWRSPSGVYEMRRTARKRWKVVVIATNRAIGFKRLTDRDACLMAVRVHESGNFQT